MPRNKHVLGVGEKEQRMYEHIKEEAKKEGRYGKRAEEVAAPDSDETSQRERPQKGQIVGRRLVLRGGIHLLRLGFAIKWPRMKKPSNIERYGIPRQRPRAS